MNNKLYEININDCYQWGKYGAYMDVSLFGENKFSGGGEYWTINKYFKM